MGACVAGREGRTFTFDCVFGGAAGQEEVFAKCARPLVEGCLEGFNATVLAYGQTGSGKTHTMLNAAQALEEEAGVTPRVLRLLYEGI